RWEVSGPHFAGWEVYHLKGSPVDPQRIYASQSTSWFGQLIQRSDDGGKSWMPVGNRFVSDGVPGRHQWSAATPHPRACARVAPRARGEGPGLRRRGGGGRGALLHEGRRADLGGARGAAGPWLGRALAARGGRDVPAHDPGRPERPAAAVGRDLLGGGVSQR